MEEGEINLRKMGEGKRREKEARESKIDAINNCITSVSDYDPPVDIPILSDMTLRNFSVQCSFSLHGPWSIGYGFSPSNSTKCPFTGT